MCLRIVLLHFSHTFCRMLTSYWICRHFQASLKYFLLKRHELMIDMPKWYSFTKWDTVTIYIVHTLQRETKAPILQSKFTLLLSWCMRVKRLKISPTTKKKSRSYKLILESERKMHSIYNLNTNLQQVGIIQNVYPKDTNVVCLDESLWEWVPISNQWWFRMIDC